MSELKGGFSPRAVAVLVGLAALSFATTILLAAYGGDPADRPTAGPNTFSYSALGQRGLASFLRREGLGVTSRQSRTGSGPGPSRPLVLAEPGPEASVPGGWEKRLEDLVAEAREKNAPLVLILPKWRALPDPQHAGWAGTVALLHRREVEGAMSALRVKALDDAAVERTGGPDRDARCTGIWENEERRRYAVEASHLQLLRHSPQWTPEVACDDGLLVASTPLSEKGPLLVVVADPDLWNNQGLGRADHAALAADLFSGKLQASGVIFDETIHGFLRTRGLLAEAFRFPLLPGVLQGLLLAGLVLWAAVGRFGQPLPASAGLPAGKEVLLENTAQLLAHAGQAADSLARYYQQTVRAVAARFFLPPDLPEQELALRLTEIGKRRGVPLDLPALERRIADLEQRVTNRAQGRRVEPRVSVLAKRLHRWRMEMTDGDRKNP